MRIRYLVFVMALLAGTLLAACGAAGGLDLDGTGWELTLLNGEALVPDTQITLRFEGGDLHGSAGCNTYGGGYTLAQDGSLQVGPMAITEMYCMDPEGVMDQEYAYMQLLGSAAKASRDGDRLTLEDGAGASILVFELVAGE
ncbi:MAG: META domain-containing protein [Anaerolineales bacterium]